MIKVGDIVKFTEFSKKTYEWATDEYYKVIRIHKPNRNGCVLTLDRKFPLDGRVMKYTSVSNIVHSEHVQVCTKEVRLKKIIQIFG